MLTCSRAGAQLLLSAEELEAPTGKLQSTMTVLNLLNGIVAALVLPQLNANRRTV